MDDIDVCRVCGKQIRVDEGRIIEHGGLSQVHPVCYWRERSRVEGAAQSPDDEGST